MGRRVPPAVPLAPLCESFILNRQVSGRSEKTILMYHFWFKQLLEQVATTAQLDSVAITRFFAGLRERKLSDSTIRQAYAVLKAFVKWLISASKITRDPVAAAGIDVKPPRTLPNPATPEEVRAVLRACPRTVFGLRNKALILLMADAGLRRSEAVGLRIEHFDAANGALVVRGGKGMKDRAAFVCPVTVRAIQAYLAARGPFTPADPLFVDRGRDWIDPHHVNTILRRLSLDAGLPRHRIVHPHGLRHLAATSWLRGGMGLDTVRRALGHASLQTTLKYSSLVSADVQREHRAAAALERMGIK